MIPIVSAAATARGRVHDVVCVGTALVDHLSLASHETVGALGLRPGAMTLVDDDAAARARAVLGEGTIVSGGTVANTAAGLASFGARAAFIGAVGGDAFGERYRLDLEAAGVVPILATVGDESAVTGACYVMVTPDEERTMATHLGVSGDLDATDVDEENLRDGAVCYFDGYLLDFPDADRIVARIEAAGGSGVAIAMGLADPAVVERHRARIHAILPHVGLLFANLDEIRALSGEEDPYRAASLVRHSDMAVVVTRSELGAIVVWPGGHAEVPAVPVEAVVDVTGAGDLFASGVLYGMVTGRGFEAAGRLGAVAASEVISHLGARPRTSLAALAASVPNG